MNHLCLFLCINSYTDILNCFEDNTFALNETVSFAEVQNSDVIKNSSFWKAGALFSLAGKFYTFQYPYPLKIDPISNKLLFGVIPNSSITSIILHNPNFIFVNSNPMVYPRVSMDYEVI